MRFLKHLTLSIAILVVYWIMFQISDEGITDLGLLLKNTNWFVVLLVSMLAILISRFMPLIFGMFIGMAYEAVRIEILKKLIKIGNVIICFGFMLTSFSHAWRYFKQPTLAHIIFGLMILAWSGNLAWFTSYLLWDDQPKKVKKD
ncbi:hypothetical protein EZ456_24880 [Pedobacter psychrodurus]|uniref:Uncharacterized protein n=2 Tax=Pedobacter psychrodurus TaxID=2530456 RepID=A0A4R0PCV4_9SPHI|nr:hypothetical protein EZ456_24880 [Pedobacter psychrodurus]